VKAQILPISAASYQRHPLHTGERAWLETNCYVDLWIEVLHAFGFDPVASLAFTVAADFEGDQWLFFKQPTGDLHELYGVDVQELNIWRDLVGHIAQQVERKRVVLVEVDAHHLPDTAGVSYKLAHSKTTIGIQRIDTEAQQLGYFHNAGYFELSGDDYKALFGIGVARRGDELVPYTEFAKIDPRFRASDEALLSRSLGQLARHLARGPRENPITAFRQNFESELALLREQPQEAFHQYAFATIRQIGANYELASSYMEWLLARGQQGLEPVRDAYATLSSQSKSLQFKAARAVMLKRPVDFAPMLDGMEAAWSDARAALAERYLPPT
jgi:LPS sulfotransferase NodH